VRDAVVYELITIESREPVVSAEPEIAARVGNDLVNAIARQAIGGGVGANGKLFGAASPGRNENQYGDENHSLHGAYDSTLRSSAFLCVLCVNDVFQRRDRRGPQRYAE
jgi:hypothetical protein